MTAPSWRIIEFVDYSLADHEDGSGRSKDKKSLLDRAKGVFGGGAKAAEPTTGSDVETAADEEEAVEVAADEPEAEEIVAEEPAQATDEAEATGAGEEGKNES